MIPRIFKPPKRSFFLFGPRGTGKTHWVKQNFPEAIYLDLLKTELYAELVAYPSRLENYIPDGFSGWIVLDEVQKIPELLNEVHRLIESKKLSFVLTGSSSRQLKRKGVNLLAGRALTCHMHPLTTVELGKEFSLKSALRWGMLPLLYEAQEPEKTLKSYVSAYLREEVLQEGLVRNLGTFGRFLETASFSQGAILNMSQIAREVFIERKVVQSYFEILEDLLLGVRLPVFTKRAKRKMVAHPKFYFFDVGVFRSVRPKGPLDTPEEIDGAALETLFFSELRAINDYDDLGYTLHYWRTATGKEVDFVAYGERGIIAFEIKRGKALGPHDLGGMRAFLEEYPMAKGFILYGGEKRKYEGKIELIPFSEGIQSLRELL